jgi:hypothetical protein
MNYFLLTNNLQHNTFHTCYICNKHSSNSKYFLSFFNNKFIIIHTNCIKKINTTYIITKFNIIFHNFKILPELTLDLSINKHLYNLYNKYLYHDYFIYFFDIYYDLIFLYKIINFSYKDFFKIKNYIDIFNNKYKNENTYLLSNFKNNDIYKIININNKLSTKDKIYIFLSKKNNNNAI